MNRKGAPVPSSGATGQAGQGRRRAEGVGGNGMNTNLLAFDALWPFGLSKILRDIA